MFELVCKIVIIVSEHSHWNGSVFMLMKFSPLAKSEVVIWTTSMADSDESFDRMTAVSFEWFEIETSGAASDKNFLNVTSFLGPSYEIHTSISYIWISKAGNLGIIFMDFLCKIWLSALWLMCQIWKYFLKMFAWNISLYLAFVILVTCT